MHSNKITRSKSQLMLYVHAILVSHLRLSFVPRRVVSSNDVMVLHCLFGKNSCAQPLQGPVLKFRFEFSEGDDELSGSHHSGGGF